MAVEPSIQVGMLILPSLVLMRRVVPGGEKDMSGVRVLPCKLPSPNAYTAKTCITSVANLQWRT